MQIIGSRARRVRGDVELSPQRMIVDGVCARFAPAAGVHRLVMRGDNSQDTLYNNTDERLLSPTNGAELEVVRTG